MKTHIVQFVRALFADKSANMVLLWKAADGGNVEEVRRLIPISYCAKWNSKPLINAARNGHTECVRLLIPVSDPRDYNTALWFASGSDSVECVKLLLTVADPKHKDSQALVSAVVRKNQEIIDVLYPVSDPDKALEDMHMRYKYLMEPYKDFAQRIEEGRFKRQLNKELEIQQPASPTTRRRKM